MFKEYLNKDLDVFFNTDEFAEKCIVDGKEIDVIIDNDRLKERSKVEYEGVIVGDILYYTKSINFNKMPKPDSMQTFNGIPCMIFDVRHDNGMYEIILKKNVS